MYIWISSLSEPEKAILPRSVSKPISEVRGPFGVIPLGL